MDALMDEYQEVKGPQETIDCWVIHAEQGGVPYVVGVYTDEAVAILAYHEKIKELNEDESLYGTLKDEANHVMECGGDDEMDPDFEMIDGEYYYRSHEDFSVYIKGLEMDSVPLGFPE